MLTHNAKSNIDIMVEIWNFPHLNNIIQNKEENL
jgi:hypothetical protein